MQLDHLAIWVRNIESAREFYETYFGATSNDKYRNSTKQFESYFLSFQSGTRLELMCGPNVAASMGHGERETAATSRSS